MNLNMMKRDNMAETGLGGDQAERFGRVAYEAYVKQMRGVFAHGDDLPEWESAPPDVQAGWAVAAVEVVQVFTKDCAAQAAATRQGLAGGATPGVAPRGRFPRRPPPWRRAV